MSSGIEESSLPKHERLLSIGTALFYEGIRVTKTKGFGGLNLAAKYGRNYRQKSCKEPWYILTNLGSLSAATSAYSKRMGIEEMFRDFKSLQIGTVYQPLQGLM